MSNRTRYIKPDFFRDEHLKNLPFEARLLFAGLWTQADREGRLPDRPERLKVELMPYDKVDINKLLDLLAQPKTEILKPFIYRYEIEGNRYIQIISWHKHQKVHHTEPLSQIPPPPDPDPDPDNVNVNIKYKYKCPSPKLEKSNGETTVVKPLSNGDTLKNQFLEFVFLTKQELEKLNSQLGAEATQDFIKRLNDYIGSTGKKYNSHYHTILCWHRKDNPMSISSRQKTVSDELL